MRLSKKDATATALVVAAAVVYILWVAGSALPFLGGTRETAAVVLALGFLASATAVVPTFVELLHGGKAYLVATSVLGAVATVAGVQTLVTASGTSFAVLMVTMVVLWLFTTVHHSLLARSVPASFAPATVRRDDAVAATRGRSSG
ncbi:MAG: hypothetical protein ACKVZ6_06375 [Kineosporiaceae bacterium]